MQHKLCPTARQEKAAPPASRTPSARSSQPGGGAAIALLVTIIYRRRRRASLKGTIAGSALAVSGALFCLLTAEVKRTKQEHQKLEEHEMIAFAKDLLSLVAVSGFVFSLSLLIHVV